jgi:glycosyltransferase involved in cell wall biosynthesis
MISLVVPIYNEEEIIHLLHDAIVLAMSQVEDPWEVVYVNDGSRDSSLELLCQLQKEDSHIRVVELSRNWGHMGALWAGMQTARGDAVVLMDGDLQDPPQVIPQMVAAWKNGAQVVTTVRKSRQESRKFLAFLFPLFYRVLGALSDFPIPLNAGIFGLLDRKALDSINSLREGNRYLPGLRAWVGYKTAIVYYDRQDRVGGEGKLTFLSRIKYAMDAITSFSYKPLRLSFVVSGLMVCIAALLGLVAMASHGVVRPIEYGVSASVFLVGSMLLFCVGILGEYVGRVYDEVRQRPLSIINSIFESAAAKRRPVLAARPEPELEHVFPAA